MFGVSSAQRNLNPLLEGDGVDSKRKIFDGIEDCSMSVTKPVVTQQEASSMMGTKGNTSVLRTTSDELKKEENRGVSQDSPKKDRTALKSDVKLSSSPDERQWSLFNDYDLSPNHLSQVNGKFNWYLSVLIIFTQMLCEYSITVEEVLFILCVSSSFHQEIKIPIVLTHHVELVKICKKNI